MKNRIALTVGLIAMAALAFGYWHVSTHGSLYVSLLDVSDRKLARPISDAELRFLDSSGKELAQAKTESRFGVVYLSQPEQYSCHVIGEQAAFSPQARQEWGRCFERQSKWLMSWVREIKYVDLKSGACHLQKIPVSVSEYNDAWWIWWVPLPHVGGKPYASFSLSIAIDRERCTMDFGAPGG